MTTISLNLDETKWQYALDKANAAASAKNDSANAQGVAQAAAAHPPATFTPVAFVPTTLTEYAQSILDGLGNSYAAQQTRDHIAVISAQPAPDIARLAKAASLPDGPERTQLAATVDALA